MGDKHGAMGSQLERLRDLYKLETDPQRLEALRNQIHGLETELQSRIERDLGLPRGLGSIDNTLGRPPGLNR
jgi:hypothetical protein